MSPVRTLVIPAAGMGTRMRSVSPDLPKEMLPLGGKPAIDYAIAEARDAGIERIVVVIREGKEAISEHLSAREKAIVFLYQDEPRGEMDAIALAEDAAGGEPVATLYPDNIYLPAPGALRPLCAAFAARGEAAVALTAANDEMAAVSGNSGRVDLQPLGQDLYEIRRHLPKGPGPFVPRFPGELRACGIRVFDGDVFDFIRLARRNLSPGAELTDGLVAELIRRQRRSLGVRLPGRLYDIGIPAGYAACCEALRGRV